MSNEQIIRGRGPDGLLRGVSTDANGNLITAGSGTGGATQVELLAGEEHVGSVGIRAASTEAATIANGEALSGEIDVRNASMIVVHMPAAWTAARLSIKAAPSSGGTFQPFYDEDGNLVRANGGANVVVSTSYALPAVVGECLFIKLWSENGAGGDTNQGAARTINVDLKS